MLKKSLNYSQLSFVIDTEGRLICCDFFLGGVFWRVICVYAHNVSRSRALFFQGLLPFLDTDRQVVLLGDFNCVCCPNDRSVPLLRHDGSADILASITLESHLVDIGSSCIVPCRFTHFDRSCNSRLDRIYVSPGLLDDVFQYSVRPLHFSDHCLVKVSFNGRSRSAVQPNWALWKLNVSILKDAIFHSRVLELFADVTATSGLEMFQQWDLFKLEVKSVAIECCTVKSFYARLEQRTLLRNFYQLCELECERPGFFQEDITLVKSEILHHEQQRFRGAAVRARSRRVLSAEHPTRQSLIDERSHALSKEILELEHNGRVVSDEAVIMDAFERYYLQLFGGNTCSVSTERVDRLISSMPTLSNDDCKLLSGPLTLSEVLDAVDALPSSKTPGSDGLSAEFYKEHKFLLSPFLLSLFSVAYQMSSLPPSFYRSHTVLIPKSSDPASTPSVTRL